MKTKLFLLLTAAVLLLSVNVSAQSSKKTTPKKTESETPLKGDVNGDGKVDVADIVAILKIMKETTGGTSEATYYWYVGTSTTPPTADNYTTILTQVDENDNPYTLTNTNVRHYMYIVVRDTKSVTSIKDGGFNTGYGEYNNITIPGHKVYRSNSAISLNGSLIITIE